MHQCATWLRQRPKTVPLVSEEALTLTTASGPEAWQREELRIEVQQAIAALPETSWLAVTLYYLAQLSCQEISAYLKVPVTTVERRLFRARRQLKAAMMRTVEETFARKRLPERLVQDTLEKLSLFPIRERRVIEVMSKTVRAFLFGVQTDGKEPSLIAVTLPAADAEAISPGPEPISDAARSKARAIDNSLVALSASGIHLKRVVLILDEARHCGARVTLAQGATEWTVRLRVSEALAMAVRTQAPLFAEGAVVRQGKVGEAGLPCPHRGSLKRLYRELQVIDQMGALTEQAFVCGIMPEVGRSCVRLRRDPAAGILWMTSDRIGGEPLRLDLIAYRAGVEAFWARTSGGAIHYSDQGQGYRVDYTLREDILEMRFTPLEPGPLLK